MFFCILVHDYNLCFTGSPCSNVCCYNYNSILPHYIVIHSTVDSDSDFHSEIIYSATYHTIKVFTYITFQYNGPRRPPLRQNYVSGMGATQGGKNRYRYDARYYDHKFPTTGIFAKLR